MFSRLLNLRSYNDEVYRRNAESSNQDSRVSLQQMIIVAFHLYHKVDF
jgi:hypothetical protein